MGDDMDGTRWLSYAELAQVRGISKASATRLVFRKGWRRRMGNDGIARVAVPLAETLPHAHDSVRGNTHDDTPDATRDTAAVTHGQVADLVALHTALDVRVRELGDEIARRARAEGELVGLREALRSAEAAAREAIGRAERAEKVARKATQRAEHAETAAVEAWRTAADLAQRLVPMQPPSPVPSMANPAPRWRSWFRLLR